MQRTVHVRTCLQRARLLSLHEQVEAHCIGNSASDPDHCRPHDIPHLAATRSAPSCDASRSTSRPGERSSADIYVERKQRPRQRKESRNLIHHCDLQRTSIALVVVVAGARRRTQALDVRTNVRHARQQHKRRAALPSTPNTSRSMSCVSRGHVAQHNSASPGDPVADGCQTAQTDCSPASRP